MVAHSRVGVLGITPGKNFEILNAFLPFDASLIIRFLYCKCQYNSTKYHSTCARNALRDI